MLFALSAWSCLFGLYLVFAGSIGSGEALAGGVAAGVAGLFAVALHRVTRRPLRLTAPWPRLIARTLLPLATDSVRVGRVLLGTLRHRPAGAVGAITRQTFQSGGPRPDDAGRRAIVGLCGSLAPNGYVTAMRDAEDTILLHRLAPVSPSDDIRWPV